MAVAKTTENDRQVGSQDENDKVTIEDGLGDITLGGSREALLLRKLDLHIIPLVMLLYTFSFLDRWVFRMIIPSPNQLKKKQSQYWQCPAL